jgi:hypothetical protein
MKERSLLYFITAVIASVLFLGSILITSQRWFTSYGLLAMPRWYMLFIPVVLLWVGWFTESKGFLLASSILVSLVLSMQLDYSGILNGIIFVPSLYAPMVKTVFVLGFMLMLGTSGLGFFTFWKLHQVKK